MSNVKSLYGLFKCFEAWSWYALEDYEQSAIAFQQAADSDGLFPEIRNQALYGAFLTRLKQCEADADMEKINVAVDYLEQYAALDFESHRALPMFQASCMVGRWDLARHICDTMIAKGDLPAKWLMMLMEQAIIKENPALALATCDELLELTQDDPVLHPKMIEQRQVIIQWIVDDSEN